MEQSIKGHYGKPELDKQSGRNKEMPPGFTVGQSSRGNPLPMLILILLILPYIKASQVNAEGKNNSLSILMKESNTILDILSAIHPYLDPEYQNGINIVFGLFETTDLLRSLSESTYEPSHILSSIDGSIDPKKRAIGIIQSLQPYITKDNQVLTNKIIHTTNALETLAKKLKEYRQQDININGSREKGIARLTEIIDTIKILVPPGQQQSFNQIGKILKMVEVLEAVQLLDSSNMLDSQNRLESASTPNEEGVVIRDDKASSLGKESNPTQNISKTLKSVLKPDQAESVELIMKMAQMLSKDSKDQNSKEENGQQKNAAD
ncbi:MAG TPA: hypothetical protein VFD57_04110 [Clostridia bacterium]|nr:hypothetical protein [Clostridia bacterium]